MTRMMIAVSRRQEALAAVAAGADLLTAPVGELREHAALAVLREVVDAAGGRAEVIAEAGAEASLNHLHELAERGASGLALAVPEGAAGAAFLTLIGKALGGRIRLVARLAPPTADLVAAARDAGFDGVRLEPGDGKALVDAVEMADIAGFVGAARRAGLAVGLGGGLKVVDVGTLLPLRPDHLVFSGWSEAKGADPAWIRAVAAALAVHRARLGALPDADATAR